MISKKYLKAALVAALLSTGYAQASGELVFNGDFETYTGTAFSGYTTLAVGDTTLTGWTVGAQSVDIVNGNYGAISGNSIDMLGTPGPGSLQQSLSTVAGQKYTLKFDLSENSDAAPQLYVSFDGGTTLAQSYLGTGTTHSYMLDFTAGASTVLKFTSAAAGNGGAVLDNVSVMAAVPEPETYGMLLAGLGLLGFIARRRKA
ncbi:DUF642 domain-containing protein [Rugamonas sp.]|uniref:DUF642 domain-containing protein n=1 Tax=Rugamonas sp. TaxID=1926287 RepID=UPI0025DF9AF8|nr:DUF642 domain-containing protein [Rugamonas sp.]